MDKKKILPIVVAVVLLAGLYFYSSWSNKSKAAAAANEICDCLERGSESDDPLANNIRTSVCLKILNNEGYRDVKKKFLEAALKETCPIASEGIEIIEQ